MILRLFRSPSRAASILGKRNALKRKLAVYERKLSERERLIATTAQLCREIGKPVPECFGR